MLLLKHPPRAFIPFVHAVWSSTPQLKSMEVGLSPIKSFHHLLYNKETILLVATSESERLNHHIFSFLYYIQLMPP